MHLIMLMSVPVYDGVNQKPLFMEWYGNFYTLLSVFLYILIYICICFYYFFLEIKSEIEEISLKG